VGHEMVLAGGRKMSKHLGNAVSPSAILETEGADADASRAARDLRSRAAEGFSRIGRFVEEYRMNAAVDEIASAVRAIGGFAAPRVETGRLGPADAAVLHDLLSDAAVALSPFAPHLAEECRARLGAPPFCATARWPGAREDR